MSEISEKQPRRELPLEKPRKAIGREFLYSKENRPCWIDAAATEAYRAVKDAVNIQRFAQKMSVQLNNEACITTFLGVGDSDSEIKMLLAMREAGIRIHSVGVHEIDRSDALREKIKFIRLGFHTFALSGDYSQIETEDVHLRNEHQLVTIMRGFHFANEDPEKMIVILNGLVFIEFGIPMKKDWRLEKSLNEGRGFSEDERGWYKKSFQDSLNFEFPNDGRMVAGVYSEAVSLGEENGISKGEAIVVVGRDTVDEEFEINRYNRLNPEYIRRLFEQRGFKIIHGEKGNHGDTEFYSLLAARNK